MIHTTSHDDGITVVRPGVDRLTAVNAGEFKAEVLKLIDAGSSLIVIDFSDVSFFDSSGIGSLVGILKKTGNRGEVVVCGMDDNLTQMFRITRMDKVFLIYRDADAAVQAMRER